MLGIPNYYTLNGRLGRMRGGRTSPFIDDYAAPYQHYLLSRELTPAVGSVVFVEAVKSNFTPPVLY